MRGGFVGRLYPLTLPSPPKGGEGARSGGWLPPGLSITAAGDITGTIKKGTAGAVKNYRVTVTAKNGAGATASATFNWQVTG